MARRFVLMAWATADDLPEEQRFPDRLGALLVAEAKQKSGHYSRVTVCEVTSEVISTWAAE